MGVDHRIAPYTTERSPWIFAKVPKSPWNLPKSQGHGGFSGKVTRYQQNFRRSQIVTLVAAGKFCAYWSDHPLKIPVAQCMLLCVPLGCVVAPRLCGTVVASWLCGFPLAVWLPSGLCGFPLAVWLPFGCVVALWAVWFPLGCVVAPWLCGCPLGCVVAPWLCGCPLAVWLLLGCVGCSLLCGCPLAVWLLPAVWLSLGCVVALCVVAPCCVVALWAVWLPSMYPLAAEVGNRDVATLFQLLYYSHELLAILCCTCSSVPPPSCVCTQ